MTATYQCSQMLTHRYTHPAVTHPATWPPSFNGTLQVTVSFYWHVICYWQAGGWVKKVRAQGSGWADTLLGDNCKHTHTHTHTHTDIHTGDENSVPSYLLLDPNLYLSPLTSTWGIYVWILTASLAYWAANTAAKLWTLTYAHINPHTYTHVCIISHTHSMRLWVNETDLYF